MKDLLCSHVSVSPIQILELSAGEDKLCLLSHLQPLGLVITDLMGKIKLVIIPHKRQRCATGYVGSRLPVNNAYCPIDRCTDLAACLAYKQHIPLGYRRLQICLGRHIGSLGFIELLAGGSIYLQQLAIAVIIVGGTGQFSIGAHDARLSLLDGKGDVIIFQPEKQITLANIAVDRSISLHNPPLSKCHSIRYAGSIKIDGRELHQRMKRSPCGFLTNQLRLPFLHAQGNLAFSPFIQISAISNHQQCQSQHQPQSHEKIFFHTVSLTFPKRHTPPEYMWGREHTLCPTSQKQYASIETLAIIRKK